jgi:hypothetical protein
VRARIAAIALVTLATACGSTVQVSSQSQLGAGGDGLGGPAGSTGVSSTGTSGTTAGGGTSTSSGGTTGTVAGGTSGAGSTGTTGAATSGALPAPTGGVPTKGPGWDAKHVYIGVTTQKDVNTAAHSVGANGLDAGDQEGEINDVIAYLNGRGGLFGRQIVAVFRDQATVATQQNPDAAGAATCSYFANDKPVIAVLNPVTLMDVDSFRSCLAQHRIPLFSASVAAVTQQIAHKYAPYFFQSVSPTWDALAPAFVRLLASQGYFSSAWNSSAGTSTPGKPTLGILTDNTVGGQQSAQVLQKALTAAGHPAKQVFTYDAHNTSTMSSAVLQFRGNEVDHVMSTDSALVAFQLQASSQGYRPRYGITSLNAPVTFLQTNGGPSQNAGDVGVGWAPTLDVDDQHDPGVISSGQTQCNAIYARGKRNFTGKRLGRAVAYAFCDGLRLIASGAVAGGGLTGVQIYNGMLKVAPTFPSAFSFASGLQPNRLYIPGGLRPLAFASSCSCFQYTSRATTRL